jgi:3-oxoacyl-[acyl-carrier-protein] synthase II
MGRRVVITGMGLATPLGLSISTIWKGLLQGTNGIVALSGANAKLSAHNVFVAGIVPPIDLTQFPINRKHQKIVAAIPDVTKMLIHAGLSALADAGISYPEETMRYGVGAIIGNGTMLGERYSDCSFDARNPKWFLETYPNLPLSYLSIIASLKGHGQTIASACVSGTQAIGEAYRMVKHGYADVLLAGGVENKLSEPFASGFSRLSMVSSEKDPDTAMMPFDKKRNGFVIGQGSAVVVVESEENALKRGASIKARVIGYGSTLDAESLTDSSRQGKAIAMLQALAESNIAPEMVDYINAHGTSTVSNDKEESCAIKQVFGERASVPINSTKSMIGHTFAACGAIEACVCCMSLMHGKIHPNRNFIEGDEYCNLNFVKGTFVEKSISYCLSNNSGLGGYNTSLIFAAV